MTALRSLPGFPARRGLISEWQAHVLSVASWRLSGQPRALEPGQVAALPASCDLAAITGRRDLALARLGLRAGRVVALTLEGIGWPSDRRLHARWPSRALRGQSCVRFSQVGDRGGAELPEAVRALLGGPSHGHLATVFPDGGRSLSGCRSGWKAARAGNPENAACAHLVSPSPRREQRMRAHGPLQPIGALQRQGDRSR